jgi:hypothetical protein
MSRIIKNKMITMKTIISLSINVWSICLWLFFILDGDDIKLDINSLGSIMLYI